MGVGAGAGALPVQMPGGWKGQVHSLARRGGATCGRVGDTRGGSGSGPIKVGTGCQAGDLAVWPTCTGEGAGSSLRAPHRSQPRPVGSLGLTVEVTRSVSGLSSEGSHKQQRIQKSDWGVFYWGQYYKCVFNPLPRKNVYIKDILPSRLPPLEGILCLPPRRLGA